MVVIVFGGRHHKLPQNKTVQCKLKNKTTERQTNENTFQNNLEKDTEHHLLQIKKSAPIKIHLLQTNENTKPHKINEYKYIVVKNKKKD